MQVEKRKKEQTSGKIVCSFFLHTRYHQYKEKQPYGKNNEQLGHRKHVITAKKNTQYLNDHRILIFTT